MNRNYVLKGLFLSLFIVVFLCSCGENTSDAPETVNLFQYALEIEDGVFVPREVDFFMSVEEVLQVTGLNEDAVSEGSGGKRIMTDVNIAGFPNDIRIIYGFSDDIGNLLISVQYVFQVGEAEAADMHNLLYEQAASAMPEASGNTIEGIKDGVDVSWEDKEQNYVRLYFSALPGPSSDNLETIDLILQATRNASFVPSSVREMFLPEQK